MGADSERLTTARLVRVGRRAGTKFYRRSFFDVVEDEVGGLEGFVHVDDWVPQRLVTATGTNPLPR